MKFYKNKFFLTLSGFQLTWISCVFGEYCNFPFFGCLIGSIYLIFFFYFQNDKIKKIKICFIYSLIGYSFDSILSFSQIFVFDSELIVGFLPIWLLFLWPSFTTLFIDILVFLKKRILLAFLIGAILVPPTYYIGIPLGLANSNNLFLAMSIMAFFWGLLMSSYAYYLYKNYIN